MYREDFGSRCEMLGGSFDVGRKRTAEGEKKEQKVRQGRARVTYLKHVLWFLAAAPAQPQRLAALVLPSLPAV